MKVPVHVNQHVLHAAHMCGLWMMISTINMKSSITQYKHRFCIIFLRHFTRQHKVAACSWTTTMPPPNNHNNHWLDSMHVCLLLSFDWFSSLHEVLSIGSYARQIQTYVLIKGLTFYNCRKHKINLIHLKTGGWWWWCELGKSWQVSSSR